MRYLYLLFFLSLIFHSSFLFADDAPMPSCPTILDGPAFNDNCHNSSGFAGWANSCVQRVGNTAVVQVPDSRSCLKSGVTHQFQQFYCKGDCTCPEGWRFNMRGDPPIAECVSDDPNETPPDDDCPDGDCPPEEPPCPSGFPRVDGQCPICVNGYNENGTCADDESGSSSSASSPPSSSPSSTPSSESPPPENPGGGDDDDGSSSSTGGGDDGNGSPGTGGGTPGGGDGGNTGGGSASSASSTAGGAGGSSGSNNSWTPHAGYGNWIPISENSPCPNKYQDNTGQWWCAGGGGSGEIPGAGQCDPTSPNYMACITQDSNSGASSSACSPSSPDYLECSGKLESAQGEITGYADSFIETIDEKTEEYKNALTEDLDNFSNEGVAFKDEPNILRSALTSLLPVSTSCNPPDIRWNGRNYELSCTYFDAFKQAVGWFFAILLAWNIYQLAIRPVDR